jgi:lipopolysaccharide transport system permease protein
VPWIFFSGSLGSATQSVVGNAQLISKVYFPRLIVPAGAVVTSLADFLISFVTLFGAMLWYHFLPSWHMLFLPFFVLMAFTAALGPGLFLTALTVKYRDFRIVMPLLISLGAWVTPVYYVSTIVPALYRPFYSLNPMVGVIDGFRWSILGGDAQLNPWSLLISLEVNVALVFLGVWYFRHTERTFADII